ncbi:FAD-dependent oxidoreductase [Kitasatospora sp. NBC_01287]|uniref:FAD-dependent oxidoreductase n=1 Tax=Kitasatospora sp. NBC_01287 TaxID=2903573 RepID=UPI00225AC59A|nr:FAD-dependent oxidoreductase [Kitasatospora sp. NBC_01287]MCX4750846.1 FAD-dependent oxidoreductase [Kitasatospora sp. NBC_01287]
MSNPPVNEATSAEETSPRLRRRGFLGAAGATAALAATATAAPAFATTTAPRAVPAPAAAPGSTGGTREIDADLARDLARKLLLVGDDGSDLKYQYLRILIDGQLPARAARKKVLVVGAGVAGLTAATLLKQAGHEVVIIEANASRTGGRVKTFRGFKDPALYAEAGAMRLPDFHPLVLALADKLNLKRRLFYNADVAPGAEPTGPLPPVSYQAFTGESWSNGSPQGPFTPPPATDRRLIRVNDLATTRAGYANSPQRINESFGTDATSTMADTINAALAPVTVPTNQPIDTQLDAWTRIIQDYDDYSTHRFLIEQAGWDLATVQAAGTLENLTSRLHYSLIPTLMDHAVIQPGNRYWELEGGTDTLTTALAAPLRNELRMGRRMTRLVQTDTGVRIETTAESGTEESCDGAPTGPVESFEGDYAIVTIPFSALRFCSVEPLMSYPKRRAVNELHYDAATKVLLEFKTRFWEQGGTGFTGGGCTSDSPSRFTYMPSHSPAGSPGGVLLASYTWSDDAMRWDSLTPGERYAFALDDLARLFGPGVRKEFTGRAATQSWARARYALGEAGIFTPGQLHELHPATRTVEGRVHFAGEHTSLKPAWIEGALESAVRTFLEVHPR